MHLLYGTRELQQRYSQVAAHIPPGCEVLDLCAGDGQLRYHLPTGTPYTAVDLNAAFLKRLAAQGVTTRVVNLKEGVPQGDCVVMMAALYHFAPAHVALVQRAVAASKRRFILAEPVRNLNNALPAAVARRLAWVVDPGDGSGASRLGALDLEEVLARVPGGRVVYRGRDWVLVWDR